MSARFDIDRESFQRFLENAFAVQQSGLDTQSLSALIEVERFIASDEFDLERAMIMIADRTLNVLHATGVAIALLEASELVYRAGSGSAARDIGRHVPAVLIVPLPAKRREILRVENAGSDTRIEAQICRQFGAMSLLMLPIYKEHLLVGVLQVLFSDAHSFLYREVLTCRLMIGALEEAMLFSLQNAQEYPERSVEQLPDEQVAPQYLQSVIAKALTTAATTSERDTFRAEPARSGPGRGAGPIARAWRNYQAMIFREAGGSWSKFIAATRTTLRRASSAKVRNCAAAIGAAIALSTATWVWVLYPYQLSDTKNTDLSASTWHGVQQALPLLPNLESSHGPHQAIEPSYTAMLPKKRMPQSIHGFKRLRVGPNEVDYIAEDVTIRKFETETAKPRIRGAVKEVKFGDDVIVRYFSGTPIRFSQSSNRVETRQTENR